MRAMAIQGRMVGEGAPCFIMAEAGVNHNGSLEMAKRLVETAVSAGADAVKFQTFKAERLASASASKAAYQLQTTDASESQVAMLRRLELSAADHRALQAYCRKRRILFLSTPFEEDSADFLADLGVPAFKIPSGEITNLPFLAHVARKGKPMIMSTGMSTLTEVRQAVETIRAAGNDQLVLLHCVSAYPADPADANLRAMQTLSSAFGVPVGYSDHTPGIEVALAAVALGACLVEKHFTLDRNLPGPDHLASLEPEELRALVRGIRIVERSLGHGRKEPTASEAETVAVVRKSVVAAHNLPAGALVERADLAMKRPGTGIPPGEASRVVGRRTRRSLTADELLSWIDLT